jgi:cytoplasmic iron level regulating protein YaaA (DUF328/UPF0246 family)
MIHILSPAKSLDFESELNIKTTTVPSLLKQSEKLITTLKKKSSKDLQKLMSISENLGDLNYERNQNWEGLERISERSRQAIFAFTGDVYQGIEAPTLSKTDVEYAQSHLRILSGLYGVLKPLDIIEPYRLEMGTSLTIGKNKSLYEFWGEQISLELNEALKNHEEKILINLASNEYFKAVDKKKLTAETISPQFKDAKNGKYKVIAFYAKKARGMMSRYILENKISRLEDLQGFDYGGYRYNADLSSAKEPVFSREENQS